MNHNPLFLLGLCANRVKSWAAARRIWGNKEGAPRDEAPRTSSTGLGTQRSSGSQAENTHSATWPPENPMVTFHWGSQTSRLDFPASSSQASAFPRLVGEMNNAHSLARSCYHYVMRWEKRQLRSEILMFVFTLGKPLLGSETKLN